MTLYVVLGEGNMPAKEVPHQLMDLWKKAEEEDTDFWFALEGKTEATDTDKELVAFFNKNQLHYGLFQLPDVTHDEAYTEVAEYFDITDTTGVLALMRGVKAEGEDVVLLSLFDGDDEPSEADANLLEIVADVLNDGFKVYGLNDALEEVVLRTEEVPAEPEPEPEVQPRRRSPKRPEATDESEAQGEDEAQDEPLPLDRTVLNGMTANEVKEVAKGMGVTSYPKAVAIDAIMDQVNNGVRLPQPEDEPAPAISRFGEPVEEEGSEEYVPVTAPLNGDVFAPLKTLIIVVHSDEGMRTFTVQAHSVDSFVASIQ